MLKKHWAAKKINNRFDFMETIALMGIEDKAVKMSANLQRGLFGAVKFGRKDFKYSTTTQTVFITEKVAFGQDANVYEYTIEQFLAG